MRILLAICLTIFSMNSFSASPSDQFSFSYLEVVALRLSISNPPDKTYENIRRLDFDTKKPATIVVEIEYSGEKLDSEELADMSSFYKDAAKVEAKDLNLSGLIVKMDIVHYVLKE